MVRIPPERGTASRLEVRLDDATANPYLATAGLLAAVHLGITASSASTRGSADSHPPKA